MLIVETCFTTYFYHKPVKEIRYEVMEAMDRNEFYFTIIFLVSSKSFVTDIYWA